MIHGLMILLMFWMDWTHKMNILNLKTMFQGQGHKGNQKFPDPHGEKLENNPNLKRLLKKNHMNLVIKKEVQEILKNPQNLAGLKVSYQKEKKKY